MPDSSASRLDGFQAPCFDEGREVPAAVWDAWLGVAEEHARPASAVDAGSLPPDRLRRALVLASRLPGRAARMHQLNHLTPVLRHVGWMGFRHRDTSFAQYSGVH